MADDDNEIRWDDPDWLKERVMELKLLGRNYSINREKNGYVWLTSDVVLSDYDEETRNRILKSITEIDEGEEVICESCPACMGLVRILDIKEDNKCPECGYIFSADSMEKSRKMEQELAERREEVRQRKIRDGLIK
jgi:hypothetical protein